MTKMTKPTLLCDSCFQMIARRNPRSAKLWVDLCDIEEHGSIFSIALTEENLVPASETNYLYILENMGFVVTTETNQSVIIQIVGKTHDDERGCYLVCGGECDDA